MTKRIAVIGGGISGLSAAYSLQKKRSGGASLEYVLLDSGEHLGGVIRTEQIDDCVVEAGPDSFLTEKVWASDLCREVGLGDQLITSNDAERKTYMLVKGRILPIPDGLMFMVPTKLLPSFLSPMFSMGTKLRIIREWLSPPRPKSSEMSVAAFVERHYGREMVDRMADPLLAGVYGGSADELSVDAVLPRFVKMEETHGSLGRAMLAARSTEGANQPRPLFTSLKNGMQQMTDAMISKLPKEVIRANTPVQSIKSESGRWLVISNGRTEEFDAIVLATPAYRAAELLSEQPDLVTELAAIPYASSLTVVLGYDQNVRAALPPGFGFLVPRTEGRKIMAATFMHNKFPHRAPQDRALIRCFVGGSVAEQMLAISDDEIGGIVRQELESILGVHATPLFTRVYKWRKAMAQYVIGHSARVARIQSLVAGMPGFALAGNAYGGIGVPDCVRSGSEAAAKVLAA